MELYPAVDIKGGKCVRLRKGIAGAETVYFENPVDAAKTFIASGSKYVHVVDLDGAFEGRIRNLKLIREISSLGIFVQFGGGMRDEDSIKSAFDAGVSRVVIGTEACINPGFAVKMAKKYASKIAVGIDARDGIAAVKGWIELVSPAGELAKKLADGGVDTFIYTDIDTDGMLLGPNISAQREMLEILRPYGARLIASGGVSSENDIKSLNDLSRKHGLAGVIVGKALYEGKIDLKSMLTIIDAES